MTFRHDKTKRGSRRTRLTRIKFTTSLHNVVPVSHRSLSRNGPYLDAHFGRIDSAAPIGQTYYLRPISTYDAKTQTLTIRLHPRQPPVHMNTNTVSRKVYYQGTIKITHFKYGKYNPKSRISVNMSLHNGTKLPLIGLHIHDGEILNSGAGAGFTNFGPIVYFLRTTPYWNRKKKEKAFPLPIDDVTPVTDYTLFRGRKSAKRRLSLT